MEGEVQVRPAAEADSRDLAALLDMAGEGIPAYIWSSLAKPGETALDVGAQRAAARTGSFAHGPAVVAESGGQVAGMLLGYRLADPYDVGELNSYPQVVRPLIQLEALVPGAWYVNAVAILEQYRGLGIGSVLMGEAERLARECDATRMSLIVAEENDGAKRLYEKLGYRVMAARAIVPFKGFVYGGDWVLMVKKLYGVRL